MNNIIIIGGGASGIVSAIFAKNKNNRVIVLERNKEPLKKLLMTGNGRCNYMNEFYRESDYNSRNIEIVDEIISKRNISEIKDFFRKIGIVPSERNGCLYPVTNQAVTVKDALLLEAKYRGVEIISNVLVKKIDYENDKYVVNCENTIYECDKLVIATGSFSYPKTGSDGMGYGFLKNFKHTIYKPLPALVPLVSNSDFCKKWDGVRCPVELKLYEDGKYVVKEEGEAQLTKYGISGICTFNLSHFVTIGLDKGRKIVLKINFVPFINLFFNDWLMEYSKRQPYKNLGELLGGFINNKLVPVIIKRSNLKLDDYYLDLDDSEKEILCKNLNSFELEIVDTLGFENAQVCNGGVSLEEINKDTMESLLMNNLYIIGELLDINGNCGGYNLTSCFITGMLAGKSIGEVND